MNTFEPDIIARSHLALIARRNMLPLFTIVLISLSAAGAAEPGQSADAVPVLSSNTSGAVSKAHATLYNEDPDDPKGYRYPGFVSWRTYQIKVAGQPDDIAIHADIEIPELKMKVGMDFKHNTDKSLPASHIFELKFAAPEDEPGHEVIGVPGLLMKSAEQARGVPLSGRAVKISTGLFLVGLSNLEADRERNLRLLKERTWIDIPMVYANQHRGILAIEKGYGGEENFNDAMTAWEQSQ